MEKAICRWPALDEAGVLQKVSEFRGPTWGSEARWPPGRRRPGCHPHSHPGPRVFEF